MVRPCVGEGADGGEGGVVAVAVDSAVVVGEVVCEGGGGAGED